MMNAVNPLTRCCRHRLPQARRRAWAAIASMQSAFT
jgi:hypothetical protein